MLSVLITVVGVTLLTRRLGPSIYGDYAVGLGTTAFVQVLGRWGVDVFLIRRPLGDREQEAERTGLALLVSLGVGAAALAAAVVAIVDAVGEFPTTAWVTLAMIATSPLFSAAGAPLARLERRLQYKRVAAIELSAQIGFYLVSLPLAYLVHSPAPLVVGFIAQMLLLSGGAFALSGWRLPPGIDRPLARWMLSYGSGYSASLLVWQTRNLAVPILVAPLAGPAAAGVVSLTVRIVETLSVAKAAVWRLAVASFGRVVDDVAKLRSAVSDGIVLQTLAVAVPLLAFGALADLVVPTVLGEEWSDVASLYPFVAIAYLVNAVFNLHSSALYAHGANGAVTRFHVIHVTVFFVSGAVAVSAWGVEGYGIAEVVALTSYVAIHHAFVAVFGEGPRYRAAALLTVSTTIALLGTLMTPFAVLVGAVPIVSRRWRDDVRSALRGRQ